jgi:hypothetical protein
MPSGAGVGGGGGGGVVGEGFTGVWTLDKARSDSLGAHLEGMGLPELTQVAAARISPTYHIRQEGSTLQITHHSELGTRTRLLTVGGEYTETAGDGSTVRIYLEMPSTSQAISERRAAGCVGGGGGGGGGRPPPPAGGGVRGRGSPSPRRR